MEERRNHEIETLLTRYLEGISDSKERHRLFILLMKDENQESVKGIIYRNLMRFDESGGENKPSADFDRIYNGILNGIKQNDARRAEEPAVNKKSGNRKTVITWIGIVTGLVISFFVGNWFKITDNSNSEVPVKENNYVEIKAPFGSKSEIKLPDGTEVMLNAGSTLKYNTDFNLRNRELNLSGEAYFKVAKNPDLPLNVNTENLIIKAVGTEFNIKAYLDQGIIETTLIEGMIEISQTGENKDDNHHLNLSPNQTAIYIKDSDSFTLEDVKDVEQPDVEPVKTIYDNILISPKVDVNQVVAWTHGKLILKGENLDDLCIDLQRKYNVTCIFNDDGIKKFRFTGVLHDETLEQVLNVIKMTAPINFYIDGKNVYLSSDKSQINSYSRHLK